jgi:bifunctional non-homologous end joining protein LigD
VITHPQKVLFPDEGITKEELAAYYEMIAPAMIPHVRGRPITMERYPAGIARKGFIQKDVSKGCPDWLPRVEVPKKDGVVHHPLVNDTRALLWIVNQNCITPHVWTSRVPDLAHPDLCVFDLDPPGEDQPDVLRRAALALRDLLDELGLPCWVKTSGSKGDGRVSRLRAPRGRAARRASPAAAHAGVQQGRPPGTDLRGHRQERLQRDVRRALRGAAETRRPRVRAVYLAGSRARPRRPPDVRAEEHGGTP